VNVLPNKTGYTLLETLLVLTILAGAGFFLLLQIPHTMEEKGMEITSTRLLEDLREVQQAAIAGNIWYRVKFYPTTNEYKIFRQGDFRKSVHLLEGVSYANSPPELIFLPTGAPSSGMTVILKSGSK
jgi:type II secretory pathway pseudopilin PulG